MTRARVTRVLERVAVGREYRWAEREGLESVSKFGIFGIIASTMAEGYGGGWEVVYLPTYRRGDVPTCRRTDVPTCRRPDVAR